ncbi:MAG TPA: outer membrane protein transport protein [Vicinamibacteria bacterium]|nr:outer membrane protein transport protein [Vicinamibacteria bacterium]
MSTSTRALAAALAACILGPAPAHAAGFAIFEQGARGMGFAGAFTAQANDPSAIFHNAAGIAFLKGKQFYLGGTLIHPSSTFTGADPFPGASVTEKGDTGLVVPPAAYYTQPFTEQLVFGIGLHTPFGLTTSWASPDTFSGRFLSERAELKGFSINPTIAYKLADRFAVGGGLDIRLSSVSLQRRVPVVNPFTQRAVDGASVDLSSNTDVGFGFNVGALAKISDSLSAGVHYRHQVKATYQGTANFTQIRTGNAQLDTALTARLPQGSQALTTSIVFPGMFMGGVAYTAGDWTFEVDADWYQWSKFSQLNLIFTDRPDLTQSIVEDYKNSWQYRMGLERRLNETWAVRGGYFFDQSPAPAASISPLLPDADRNGFALGGTWKTGRFHADAAMWVLLSPARSTEGINRDDFNGTYKSHAVTLGIFLGYSF